jgi:cysteine desulfurase / selenocysteine lyase
MTTAVKSFSLKSIDQIRKNFPMLQKRINKKPIIYFDNAATGHKPETVIQRLREFYMYEYGKPKEEHQLSKEATKLVEEAREKMALFINAPSEKCIVFSRGCTENINIVAGGFAKGILKAGDEVLITALEHHANIIPWQMACAQTGAVLRVAPILPSGEIDLKAFERMLTDKTKIVAVSHTSHVLGTILPVKAMTAMAHKKNIPVMIDGAQAAPHKPVNMQDIDCEFYTFSAHKMGGPSGVGVLYGKKKWLEKLPPYEGGSDMAKKVSFEKTEYADVPTRFEAGTMPFADIIAFGDAVEFLQELDLQMMFEYEQELLRYATEEFLKIPVIQIKGEAAEKEATISFSIEGIESKEIEKYLSEQHNIFVRAGDLSAQPLMEVLGVKDLIRVSFSYYNTKAEIDKLITALGEFLKAKN